jgi:hypothetical protein
MDLIAEFMESWIRLFPEMLPETLSSRQIYYDELLDSHVATRLTCSQQIFS